MTTYTTEGVRWVPERFTATFEADTHKEAMQTATRIARGEATGDLYAEPCLDIEVRIRTITVRKAEQ